MRLRVAGILLLASVVVGLAPLASAVTTDPSWVAGLWDGDDDDDAILAAVSGVAVLDAITPPVGLATPVRDLPPVSSQMARADPVPRPLVRAPPIS